MGVPHAFKNGGKVTLTAIHDSCYICGKLNLDDRVMKVADIYVTSVKAVEVDNKIPEELTETNEIDQASL